MGGRCGGAALSVPGPTAQRVSDCPGSGSSAASPSSPRPPARVSQGSTPGDVTTGGWRRVWVLRPLRPLRTPGGSGGAEGRGRRGVGGGGLRARARGGASARARAGLCKKLYVTSKCVCLAETQLPGSSPPQYTHLQGLEGRGWPPCLPLPPQEGLPRLGWCGRCGGSCKGVWQPLGFALLPCVTLNRCLVLTEPSSAPS